MKLVEFKAPTRFAETFNHTEFSERLYFSLKEQGFDIPFGVWHSKFIKNGLVKIVKSLGLYKVTGARDSKKVMIHPRLKVIINSTCGSNEEISKTIIDLVNGKYSNVEEFGPLDLSNFKELPDNDIFSTKPGYGTYIIKNNDSNLYKIGRSKNVINRLNSLKKDYGPDLHLIAFNSKDIEQFLHEKMKTNRVFGEWFDCSIDNILDIIKEHDFIFNNK